MMQSTENIPLDEIHMANKEWLHLYDSFDKQHPDSWDTLNYLVHPALPFYRLILTGEDGIADFIIDYLPPRYYGVKNFQVKGGFRADIIVAVRISGRAIPSEAVVCLGAIKKDSSDYNSLSDFVVKKPDMVTPDMVKGLAWTPFCVIQGTMIERPVVFHTQLSKRCEIGPARNSSSKRHKVKNLKVITLIPDALAMMKSNVRKHEITCPCWGVTGHWRYYKKSGRRVWIDAYSKGKCRDNPDAYMAKEYQIVTEEVIENA